MRTIRNWIAIGVAEILGSLVLVSVAPLFINSNYPIIGLMIWIGVLALLGGSVLHVLMRLLDAQKARMLFISAFPNYDYLALADFLAVSSAQIAQRLEVLRIASDDPDFQQLQISPLDLLRRSQVQ